jgi:O-antigen ligase
MRGRDIASALIGFVALATAIFAVGGSTRGAQAVVAALVTFALVPLITSRRVLDRPSPLIVVLGIAAALTALQLLPLPGALIDVLQPMGTALRRDGGELVGTAPRSIITLDPAETLRALAGLLTLLGLAVVALRLAVTERGRFYLVASIAACCGAGAAVVGVHELLQLRVLYGLYDLNNVNPHLLGPLLNMNHLGGLMAIGTIVSMGLVAYRRQKPWLRPLWLANAAACGYVVVATVSRGATLALIAGTVVTGGTLAAQRLVGDDAPKRRRIHFLKSSLPIGIVAVCTVLIVVFSNAGNVMSQLSHTSAGELGDSRTKFAAWKSAIALVEEAPILGIGRGAFETSFTRVHPGSSQATFSHVENEYLQVVIDWGLLGGGMVLLAGAWLALRILRRWRDGALAASVLGALMAVALQSTVDFGVELLGLAAPVTVLLAVMAYVPLRDPASPRGLRTSRALRMAHLIALGTAVFVLLSSVTTTVDEDHDQLRKTPTIAATRESLERHPLDYYSFAIASEIRDRSNDARSIRLLNHAMTLHPFHPGLHRTAARMLLRAKYPAQAAVEYAAALRVTAQKAALIKELASELPPEQAVQALPTDARAPQQIVKTLEQIKRSDLALEYLRRLVRLPTMRSSACDLLFSSAIAGAPEAADLAIDHCLVPLPDYATRVALAQVLARKQAYAEVEKLLGDVESWQSAIADKRMAWLVLCDSYVAAQKWDEGKRCLRRLDISSDSRPEERVVVEKRLLDLEDRRRKSSLDVGSGSGSSAP